MPWRTRGSASHKFAWLNTRAHVINVPAAAKHAGNYSEALFLIALSKSTIFPPSPVCYGMHALAELACVASVGLTRHTDDAHFVGVGTSSITAALTGSS